MRKLASIQIITDIQLIEGADRIQVAQVLGWQCVIAKKDNFQVGEKVVYIEVDSIVPEKPEFEFLRERKFRVRTIKLKKQVSQGLIIPTSLLPKGNYKEDQDVTDILGIIKYDPEGDLEEKLANQKEKTVQDRIKKYLYRFSWYRNLFPKKSGKFPEFLTKTDETRIQAIPKVLNQYAEIPMIESEKIDGCFDGRTRIMTDVGEVKISTIFKNKDDYKIASYNTNKKEIEFKEITDVHKIDVSNKNIYKIGFGRKGKGNREKYSYCTENHEWFTNNNWIRADKLNIGDEIFHFSPIVKNEIKEIMLGCLLGDSSLNSNYKENNNYWSINFNHSIKQLDYFQYKKQLLGSLFIEQNNKISGFGSLMKMGITKSNLDISQYLSYLFPDHKKIITEEVANELSPISLAFWFMDDGSLSHRDEEFQKPRAILNTQGFSLSEMKILQKAFINKFNIQVSIGEKDVYGGYVLIFDKSNTQKLSSIISPYICKSMRYKLPKHYENLNCYFENICFDLEENIVPTKILSIEKIDNKLMNNTFYDLTIKDNHNYFANGILVHNCSSTFFLLKKKFLFFWTKYEFGVCSRNLQLPKPDNSNWWNCVKKYNIENILKELFVNLGVKDFVAIQGEIAGKGIQENKYNFPDQRLFVFNLIIDGKNMNTLDIQKVVEEYDLETVPVLNDNLKLSDFTMEDLVNHSNAKSVLYDTYREGIVIRDYENTVSFKVISPEFLLKHNL